MSTRGRCFATVAATVALLAVGFFSTAFKYVGTPRARPDARAPLTKAADDGASPRPVCPFETAFRPCNLEKAPQSLGRVGLSFHTKNRYALVTYGRGDVVSDLSPTGPSFFEQGQSDLIVQLLLNKSAAGGVRARTAAVGECAGSRADDVWFLDVGSNIGVHSLAVSAAGFPAIAIEATPATAERLRCSAVFNHFSSLVVVNAAVGNAPGSKLCISIGDDSNQGGNQPYAMTPASQPAQPAGASALPPCAALPRQYLPGCAAACAAYSDVASAQAACAAEPACGGITSGNNGVAPWQLRAGTTTIPSSAGEVSYVFKDAAACQPPAPSDCPEEFSVTGVRLDQLLHPSAWRGSRGGGAGGAPVFAKLAASPTVVKMDVEGSEGLALLGYAELLGSVHRPPYIFIELQNNLLARTGHSEDTVFQLLASKGYNQIHRGSLFNYILVLDGHSLPEHLLPAVAAFLEHTDK